MIYQVVESAFGLLHHIFTHVKYHQRGDISLSFTIDPGSRTLIHTIGALSETSIVYRVVKSAFWLLHYVFMHGWHHLQEILRSEWVVEVFTKNFPWFKCPNGYYRTAEYNFYQIFYVKKAGEMTIGKLSPLRIYANNHVWKIFLKKILRW